MPQFCWARYAQAKGLKPEADGIGLRCFVHVEFATTMPTTANNQKQEQPRQHCNRDVGTTTTCTTTAATITTTPSSAATAAAPATAAAAVIVAAAKLACAAAAAAAQHCAVLHSTICGAT